MVEKQLTDKMVEFGSELINSLDIANVKTCLIMWNYYTDTRKWKLIISINDLRTKGPKFYYSLIQKILKKNSSILLSLDDIVLLKSNEPIVEAINSIVESGINKIQLHLSETVFNGIMIDDAFVYRSTKNKKK